MLLLLYSNTTFYAITESNDDYNLYLRSNDGKKSYGSANCRRHNGSSSCVVSTTFLKDLLEKDAKKGTKFYGWATKTNFKATDKGQITVGYNVTITKDTTMYAVFK